MSKSVNKMSVLQLTILTAVNMMGSGIIMLPSKLAQVGALSIVSWLVTALGSLCLAYVFAKCGMYSKKGGGMGGYAEYSFGKAGNFMANYTYGVSLIFANTAIAISAVGYACGVLDATLDPVMTCAATVFTLWLATVLNFGGAKYTGQVSSITVWGVIIPCIGLALGGWFWFSPSLYAVNWNVHDLGFGEAAMNAITMTLWAFLGLESACANADAVDNPESNVPKAVLGGTLIAAACYIVSTNIIFGIVPAEDLVSSSAPFGLVFAQIRGVPILGMIAITITQSLFSLMTISPSLNEQFETLVNLAVITNIIPYLLCMAAVIVIMKAAGHEGSELSKTKFLACLASVYSLYACYASGFDAMTYGAIVTFFGWTLYGLVSYRFDLKKAKDCYREALQGKA